MVAAFLAKAPIADVGALRFGVLFYAIIVADNALQ